MGIFSRTGAALALAIGVMAAAPASAVTFTKGSQTVDVTCTLACHFWLLDDPALDPQTGAGSFSSTAGSWLSGIDILGTNDNGDATRIKFVNEVLKTAFTDQSESSDSGAAPIDLGATLGSDGSWTGSAKYYLAWGGGDPRYVLIENKSANNTFSWKGDPGLSGVDGFGVVPLPAAGWMLLASLGGFAVIRRRKTATTA